MVTREQEQELNGIIENSKTKVKLGNGFVRIGWQKKGTMRKCTEIYSDTRKDAKTEEKISNKAAAAIVLNSYWKIMFFYPILWRWYHYIKQYSDEDVIYVLIEGKKKAQRVEYYLATTLVEDLRDTQQTMTREEASRFRQEQSSALVEQ